uniref:Tripartite motif containing 46 n=1 Tax=Chelydra serpentina TaxID=8475 RepID=A0A8C3XUT0_CHESE
MAEGEELQTFASIMDALVRISTSMKNMERELICPVCKEMYKQPLALPCMHNVCHVCASEILVQHGYICCDPSSEPTSPASTPATRSPRMGRRLVPKPDRLDRLLKSGFGTYPGRKRGAVHPQTVSFPCPACQRDVDLGERGLGSLFRNLTLERVVERYRQTINIGFPAPLILSSAPSPPLSLPPLAHTPPGPRSLSAARPPRLPDSLPGAHTSSGRQIPLASCWLCVRPSLPASGHSPAPRVGPAPLKPVSLPAAPEAPVIDTQRTYAYDQIFLCWRLPQHSPPAWHFTVEYRKSEAKGKALKLWQRHEEVRGTSALVEYLDTDSVYVLRVKGCNKAGFGEYSEDIYLHTPPAPVLNFFLDNRWGFNRERLAISKDQRAVRSVPGLPMLFAAERLMSSCHLSIDLLIGDVAVTQGRSYWACCVDPSSYLVKVGVGLESKLQEWFQVPQDVVSPR